MDQQTLVSHNRMQGLFADWYWACLLIGGIALVGLLESVEAVRAAENAPFEQLLTFNLFSYANLLLVGSTVLYVSHLWFTSEAIGQWASGLATLGALASTLALSVRWFGAYFLHYSGAVPLGGLYEVMALFSTVTVVIYLVMERVYRTRAAGAFVMLIVLASVIFQIWLATDAGEMPGARSRILKSYWMHAHVLGNFIGYGAFAIAAAMGTAYLVKARAQIRSESIDGAIGSLPELHRIDALMHKAIQLGFPVFTLATILGSLWAYQAWGRYWAWDPKETWALIVWVTYASYFFLRRLNNWSSARMAWWAIIGFALTLFCFLGASALWPGLHVYK